MHATFFCRSPLNHHYREFLLYFLNKKLGACYIVADTTRTSTERMLYSIILWTRWVQHLLSHLSNSSHVHIGWQFASAWIKRIQQYFQFCGNGRNMHTPLYPRNKTAVQVLVFRDTKEILLIDYLLIEKTITRKYYVCLLEKMKSNNGK